MLATAAVVAGVNVALGLAAVVVLAAEPLALVLLVGPAGAVFLAYRAYQSERSRHLSLEFLYEVSRTLTTPTTGRRDSRGCWPGSRATGG
jgi:threonine/homoserine/homoserine lactone efflux protein